MLFYSIALESSTTEQQAGHAREQLNHINALLVEQMIAPESSTMTVAPTAELPSASPDLPALLSASLPVAIPDKSTPAAKAQPKQMVASKRQAKAAPELKPVITPAGEQGKMLLLPSFAGLGQTRKRLPT
jgi:hypothetical protein